jgi:hypothetical protein
MNGELIKIELRLIKDEVKATAKNDILFLAKPLLLTENPARLRICGV